MGDGSKREPGVWRFAAPIVRAAGGGAYVVVPFDVESEFGRRRVPVVATFDGIEYRGSLVRMGGREHVLGVLKEIRERIGKGDGDPVDVVLREDTDARTVAVPADLADALEAAGARVAFDALAYSHRREHVRWIDEAKRPETRQRRVTATVEKVTRAT